MSLKTTPVTQEIEEYIYKCFTREEAFLNDLREEALGKGFPSISISPNQGTFLRFILKAIKAKYVLEIGSLFGYSAITMALALPLDGRLISLEINEDYCDFIRQKAEIAGLSDKIEVVNCNALEFLKEYKSESMFDFIFIDADKENYLSYLKYSLPLLKRGGIIAADNALAFGQIADKTAVRKDKEIRAVDEFNRALADLPELSSCLVTIGDGIAMAIKN